MAEPLILTCDIGTQSARSVLVDKRGRLVDVCQVKYGEAYYSRNPGWAEQRPGFYFDRLCEATKMLLERNEELKKDIIAMTITAIRDTVLCLDENNEPLRDIILWLDQRKAEVNDPFPLWKKLAFKAVGMEDSVNMIYEASVGNWIMQNEPEIWAKTKKYVMLPTYLNYKLTGRLIDSPANMIGHVPFDYQNRKWMKKSELTRCVCDIPEEKLCELIPSGEVIGKITKEVSEISGIPEGLELIATGSDKGCETLGLSVYTNDRASVSYGTTATIQLAVKKYFEPQKFMPAYPAVPNDLYNPEIQIYRGFWLLSWYIREFGYEDAEEAKKLGISTEEFLDRQIEKIPPGSEGLLLQPYWTPGITLPNSLGAVVGFSDFHTRYHLYRAIIEGIAFELYDSLMIMEKRSGLKIKEIYVGGGGSKSDIVCQITADIFRLPVKRIQTHEACSIGSSMVAFVSKGEFADYHEAAKSMVHVKDFFMPNDAASGLYTELYEKAYKKLYPSLDNVYEQISRIYKRR